MKIRRAYNYAAPTTLVAIISDAIESVDPTAGPLAVVRSDVREIVREACYALGINVGLEDMLDMLLAAGIDANTLDWIMNY